MEQHASVMHAARAAQLVEQQQVVRERHASAMRAARVAQPADQQQAAR
jgi:hypothetical protein